MRQPSSVEEEVKAFADRLLAVARSGTPVKIQAGFGMTPLPGFLNLDVRSWLPESDTRFTDCEVFYFPFADMPWPIPDNCVDYIFHEDFIEHISQKQQVCFLAETLRVLKPGCWHRVNTPCLNASMKRHANFKLGTRGVYVGEWEKWNHISLFTRHSLEELAKLVGYREVVFNQKGQSVSPHRCRETRPADDRDAILGNIFADLLK
jgi:SAM-dependent methyltransferase